MMRLIDRLTSYRDSGVYPMHMPGHKRNPNFLRLPDAVGLDITEIDGFDDLHDARGVLAEGMLRASALYGSDRSFYLVNGSSGGILAGITACTRPGEKVLVARNSHRSVFNAVALNALDAVYLYPEIDVSFGIQGSVTPESVADALARHGDIRLIVLTSPTYDGVVSDITAIVKLAHARGIAVLVDAAHGAHFGFSERFPSNAVSAGADVVVHSLHKTLPALTQSALLHVGGNLVDAGAIARQLAVFETSSPSYLLMAGIDACIALLARRGEELFSNYAALLDQFSLATRPLKHIRLFNAAEGHPAVFDFDPGKLLFSVAGTTLTGAKLYERLLTQYYIQLEMAYGDCALAMTSICDTPEGFDRLASALHAIDAAVRGGGQCRPWIPVQATTALPIHAALARPGTDVPLTQSAGRVSREYVYAYPPGIPLLVPGETLAGPVIESLLALSGRGIALRHTFGRAPGSINVIDRMPEL